MQTQDFKYISMKRTIEGRKIKRLQAQLHLTEIANQTENKHTFFVDTLEEAKNFDVAQHLKTHPLLLARKTNRIQLKDMHKISLDLDDSVIFQQKIEF